jgi:chromosome segregation ATPase
MDPKTNDLQGRLARLTREEENLNAEVRELLPAASDVTALTGEKLAKYKWIESRLDEIQAWKRQLAEKLNKVKREQTAGR